MTFSEILEPPLDVGQALSEVPELTLARGLAGSPYHHLDTLDHILEVVRLVEAELAEGEVGARVSPEYLEGLRMAALLHDVAKPVTRGEYEGKAIFVAHDTLGAMMARRICARLAVSAVCTDIAATLTALHLKIGFMASDRTDYPPKRLVRAAGPFGEELAVLSWADRLAAQGPRLRDEHIERHKNLCRKFLEESRESGPHPPPEYGELRGEFASEPSESKPPDSEIGYAAARLRLSSSGGVGWKEALGHVRQTTRAGREPS